MAIPGYLTPFMGQVSAGATAAGQDLFTLMSTVFSNLQHKCCFLQIQLDVSAAGATLYVGNSNVATTMYGSQLSAGQVFVLQAFDSNLLVLDQIFLLSSTGTLKANVIVVTR